MARTPDRRREWGATTAQTVLLVAASVVVAALVALALVQWLEKLS